MDYTAFLAFNQLLLVKYEKYCYHCFMIKLKLLNRIEAIEYIMDEDLYMKSITPFYIQKILKRKGDMNDFISNFQQSICDFNDFSIYDLNYYEKLLNNSLKTLKLNINETIYMIATNGKDNIGLPYTKSKAIIIPYNGSLLNYSLTVHEIFHVLSRNNESLRKKCYKSLNWINANKNLFSDINDVFINPDACSHDHYLKIMKNDKIFNIAPIMINSIFNNQFGIFDDNLKLIKIVPFSYFDEYQNLWKNTNYNNHPEELSAEHFSAIICSTGVYNLNDPIIGKSFYLALFDEFGN